jgi:sugar O-acyltransferase (sialic acid O-acetyltransferase NeuD family)
MQDWVIVGARNFGREVICWIHDLIQNGIQARIAGFVDDDRNALAGYDYDLPWLGSIEEYRHTDDAKHFMSVSDPLFKEKSSQLLQSRGVQFNALIHPTAVIAQSAKLGDGVVFCPHSVASADAKVDAFVTVNCQSAVGHDVHVGAYSTLSSFVDLTGRSALGKRVLVGSGARLLPGVVVGDDAKIGAGAIVVRAVPSGATMYAAPARRL